MDPSKYFSYYILKNAGRKQKFGYAKNGQFGREIFTSAGKRPTSRWFRIAP